MVMMVITTIISTKVKPRAPRRLPLRVCCAIACLLRRLTVDIEYALAAPALALGVVLIAAHAPFGFARERIDGDAEQEADFLSIGPGEFDALHQNIQRFGPI